MTQPAPTIPARIVVRSIALAVAYLGMRFLIGAFKGILHHDGSAIGRVFEIAISLWCLLLAYRGWLPRSARSVRWLCIVAAIAAFFFVFNSIDATFVHVTGFSIFATPSDKPGPGNDLVPDLFILMLAVFAMLLYRLLVAWLLPRLCLSDDRTPRQRRRAMKWSIGLVTFAIIASGGGIASYLSAGAPLQYRDSQSPMEEFSTLVVLLFAIVLYEWGMSRARRNHRDVPEPVTPKTDGP